MTFSLSLFLQTLTLILLCGFESSVVLGKKNSKYVNIVPGMTISLNGNIHPSLKQSQFDIMFMNQALENMAKYNNNILVLETPFVEKSSLLKNSLIQVANMQDLLEKKATDSISFSAIPLDNYVQDVANSFFDIKDLSQLDKVQCKYDEPCVVMIRLTEDNIIDFVLTADNNMFERISNIFGGNFQLLWTTKKVIDDDVVAIANNNKESTSSSNLQQQQQQQQQRHLTRHRRSLSDDNSDIKNKKDPFGYPVDYKLLSPAILQGIAVGLIFITLFSMGVMGMASLQSPVRYQDAKIPTVGKE